MNNNNRLDDDDVNDDFDDADDKYNKKKKGDHKATRKPLPVPRFAHHATPDAKRPKSAVFGAKKATTKVRAVVAAKRRIRLEPSRGKAGLSLRESEL